MIAARHRGHKESRDTGRKDAVLHVGPNARAAVPLRDRRGLLIKDRRVRLETRGTQALRGTTRRLPSNAKPCLLRNDIFQYVEQAFLLRQRVGNDSQDDACRGEAGAQRPRHRRRRRGFSPPDTRCVRTAV